MYQGIFIVGYVSMRMNTHQKPVQHVLKRVVSVVSISIRCLGIFSKLQYKIKTATYLISKLNAFYDQWMEDGESGVLLGAAVLDAKKRENEYVTIPHLQEMEPQNVRVAMA